MNTPRRQRSSQRLASLSGYAFAEVSKRVEALRAQGIDPVDFGVGDPVVPTPQVVRDRLKLAVEERAASGYPSYQGDPAYRTACAAWMKGRFGLDVDPDREICGTIGSKEAVFNLHEALLDPGDVILVPSPGYPPYKRGAHFAEATPYFYPLLPENDFLPDLDAIPEEVRRKAKAIWVCYPNSPSGAVADLAFYERLLEQADRYDWIVLSDEAYSEIYFTEEKPPSVLQVRKEGVLTSFSLSKRSAMTGWRIGWVAGDPELVGLFMKLKTNVDSGTPTFIQDAAIAALEDEDHVIRFREDYRQKRDVMLQALHAAGLPDCTPPATLYIWQKAPEGMSGIDLAGRLLEPDIAAVTTPGEWISDETDGGVNPGAGFIRFALVPDLEDVKKVADKIAALRF